MRGLACEPMAKDPLLEYKHEAYEMFMEMIAAIQEGIVTLIFKVRLVDPAQAVAQRQIQGRTNEDTIGGTSGFLSAAKGWSRKRFRLCADAAES